MPGSSRYSTSQSYTESYDDDIEHEEEYEQTEDKDEEEELVSVLLAMRLTFDIEDSYLTLVSLHSPTASQIRTMRLMEGAMTMKEKQPVM